jgi:hypothetical protein
MASYIFLATIDPGASHYSSTWSYAFDDKPQFDAYVTYDLVYPSGYQFLPHQLWYGDFACEFTGRTFSGDPAPLTYHFTVKNNGSEPLPYWMRVWVP